MCREEVYSAKQASILRDTKRGSRGKLGNCNNSDDLLSK